MKYKIITLLLACLFLLAAYIYIFRVGFIERGKQAVSIMRGDATVPTPTPFPFSDLTIPYLQKRAYKGELDERAVNYETPSYTAYLTSYLSDGLKINGLLTVPKNTEPEGGFPAIVFVHGYIPPASYQTTQNYYDYVDYLAKNGFVVFKIDLRGHGNSQGEPSGAYYSSDYIIDTLGAYNALQNSGFVNSEKIGLWGHSMAGNVVTRAMAAKKDIPAAAVWAGAVFSYEDFQKYGIQDGSYVPPANNTQRVSRRTQLFNTYGQFNNSSEFWKQVPVTNYLHDIQGAIQLHHATNDDVVNIGFSRDFKERLDASGKTAELHEYPTGGHNINGAGFIPAMEKTVLFFKKYLR